jgi:predicted Zn-dependent protease
VRAPAPPLADSRGSDARGPVTCVSALTKTWRACHDLATALRRVAGGSPAVSALIQRIADCTAGASHPADPDFAEAAMPPTRLEQAFESALRHHQQGHLREAEHGYRSILSRHPRHPDTLHLLGLVAFQTGDRAGALKLLEAAVAALPGMPLFRYHGRNPPPNGAT